MDFLLREMPGHLWQARESLAAFLGADPRRLIFTANVTASINIVASGLALAAPGEILLTDHEYGAMHWCWERAAQAQRVDDPHLSAADPGRRTAAKSSMPPSPPCPPRRGCFSSATCCRRPGWCFPPRSCAPRPGGAASSPSSMAPMRRRWCRSISTTSRADFYGANCHKWLLAPTGSGFLYLGKGSEDRLQPLQVSWGWRPDRAAIGSARRGRLDAAHPLFTNSRGRATSAPGSPCPTAIEFQAGLGFEQIRRHNERLVQCVRARFAGIAALSLATPTHPRIARLPDRVSLAAERASPSLAQGVLGAFPHRGADRRTARRDC